MARETQKEKIDRLEKEIEVFKSNQLELNKIIDTMIDKANNSFENSSDFIMMSKKIDDLEIKLKAAHESANHNRKMFESESKAKSELIERIKVLESENKLLKEKENSEDMQQIINKTKVKKENIIHNERGAGRKPRFTNEDIENMKRYRIEKITIKEIARIFNCSVGLVHKLTSEN